MDFSTTISSVIASTTAQVWTVVTTAMQPLWVFLISIGAVLMVAGIIVGIFHKRRGGRRRGR